MKKAIVSLLLFISLFTISACTEQSVQAIEVLQTQEQTPVQSQQSEIEVEERETEEEENMSANENRIIQVRINGMDFVAELNESQAAQELYELLPLTVEMTELHGNEKYYVLPEALTTQDEQVASISNGDIMLFAADYLVLFYDSFQTSYAYTPLGRIVNTEGLKEAVGNGNVTVTFEKADVEENISQEVSSDVMEPKFQLDTRTVMLNSGYEMPIAGIGTYSLLDDTCVNSVVTELQSGGRLIDTAYMYHNEESIGEGIRQSGVEREEIFVTTKLYPNQYADAENAIDEALNKLGVEYIDLTDSAFWLAFLV